MMINSDSGTALAVFNASTSARRGAERKTRLRPDLSFAELIAAWNTARRPAPKTLYGARRAVAQLTCLIGDVPVVQVDSLDLFDYRDALAGLPRSLTRAERRLPFVALVEHFGTAHHDRPLVRAATVRKQLRLIQSLLGFAYRERWTAENVGREIPVAEHSIRGDRRAFSRDEASTFFALPLFTRPWSVPLRSRQISDNTLRWLALIAFASGARLEEIGQLQTDDIQVKDDIVYMFIDDADADGVPTAEKSIKNAISRRRVPLHSDLLKLGLAKKAEQLKQQGVERLFADLPRDAFGRYTSNASRCCNRFIDRVSKDPRLVFHSFRHLFKDLCREAGMLECVSDQLTGHVPISMGGRYGDGVSLHELKVQIERLRFEFVDWERIYAASRL